MEFVMFLYCFHLLDTFAIDDAMAFPAFPTSTSKYLRITVKILTPRKLSL